MNNISTLLVLWWYPLYCRLFRIEVVPEPRGELPVFFLKTDWTAVRLFILPGY